MSQENVETLRQALEAFNRRDKAAWIAVVDPEAENFPPMAWPENAPIRGPEAIWNFYVEAVNAWEEGEFEWGEFIDAGKEVVVANQLRHMRGKTSGAAVEWSYWVVFEFRDGKVVRTRWFAERDAALEDAGLSE